MDPVRLRPRVGLAGSFGRGNYGDELYVRTFQHWLGDWADLRLLVRDHQQPYFGLALAPVESTDAVILGGGDLLCPYRPLVGRDFVDPRYLRRRVHVTGIGVERNRPEIDPTVVQVWREFLTSPSIGSLTARDAGSAAWLLEHVAPTVGVGVHPDLVCALPLPPVVRPAGAPILGLVTRHTQRPADYVLLAEVGRRLSERGWRVRHIIGGVGKHGRKDFENARQLAIPGKETMFSEDLDDISRALGECSLVLSMKLHTTIVATMYGVPTICVNPVVKARAFMRSIGREELVVSPRDERLLELIDAGVPEVPMDEVERLRAAATASVQALGQRIWDEFRSSSPWRFRRLPASPTWSRPAARPVDDAALVFALD